MKKIETKDPAALDLLAARDDKARVFFDHGRTEGIAFKRAGKFGVALRAREMKRIIDVQRECLALDKQLPTWNRPPICTLPCVMRAK